VVQEQIQDALLLRRHCPECGQARHRKGAQDVTIRTLFGNIELQSPGWNTASASRMWKRPSARFRLSFPSTPVRKCDTWK
jgi:hypothetical protein